MNELHLQDRFLIPFFRDDLGYQEVKANTVTQSLIIEAETYEPEPKQKKPPKVAEGGPSQSSSQLDILAVIAARNEQEAKTGVLIQEFEAKILNFFDYVRRSPDGERLIVKMKSHVSETEIYEDFGKIYRRYRALNRQTVGEYFFKEIDDLVDKLCDDFETTMRDDNK